MNAIEKDISTVETLTEDLPRQAHLHQLLVSFADRMRGGLIAIVCVGLLIAGWFAPLDDYLNPEDGLGYLFGIVGASMMTLLLIYPARKRLRKLGVLGSQVTWFRIHMMLGLFGPIFILYHARFSVGSLNSSVALFSMILVAGSGVVGRYLYSKIHYGLYGAKAKMEDLQFDSDYARDRFMDVVKGESQLCDRLRELELAVGEPASSLLNAMWRYPSSIFKIRLTWQQLLKRLRIAQRNGQIDRAQFKDAVLYSRAHRAALRKAIWLQFFERLFALWHVAHIPLFIMLVLTAIAHIVAVHMF